MFKYEDLSDKLMEVVPELRPAYEKELAWWGDDQPGQHVVYGDVLNPYLISLLESGDNPETLRRIFDLLEKMANHPDVLVQQVVAVTVCEQLTDREEWITEAWPYMGSKTRELAKEVADFWGNSSNFPFGDP